jgi:hypothetical protein
MAVLQLFLVRNSAIDLVVHNIAELRTKIADATFAAGTHL